MSEQHQQGLDYKSAGVDIEAGNQLVERIKPIAAKTKIPGVMAGLGGFGSLFELPLERYQQPVLVSGTIFDIFKSLGIWHTIIQTVQIVLIFFGALAMELVIKETKSSKR